MHVVFMPSGPPTFLCCSSEIWEQIWEQGCCTLWTLVITPGLVSTGQMYPFALCLSLATTCSICLGEAYVLVTQLCQTYLLHLLPYIGKFPRYKRFA